MTWDRAGWLSSNVSKDSEGFYHLEPLEKSRLRMDQRDASVKPRKTTP